MSYVLSLQDHVLFLTVSICFCIETRGTITAYKISNFQPFLAKIILLYTAASSSNVSFIIFSKTLPSPFSNTVSLQCGVVNKLIKNCRTRIPLRIEENAIWKT